MSASEVELSRASARVAAAVTAAVCKASAGAVEHLPLARVRNLVDFLADAKAASLWCYGAEASTVSESLPPGPVVDGDLSVLAILPYSVYCWRVLAMASVTAFIASATARVACTCALANSAGPALVT